MTYIKNIQFYELNIWDVKTFFLQADIFNPKYPFVLFGDFLTKANIDKIKIEDTKEYKILGVRAYGKGAFINRTVKGNTLKMRTYQLAKENHLFWCKVDTKNGAFGIITKELADGVASSNMTFAEIDTSKANTEYVQLLFKSPKVNKYMDGYVTGTTNRKYIKPDQLREEIKIPLPPLSEQNRIVKNYNAKIKIANKQEKQAEQLEIDIENYLFEALGIEKLEEKKVKKGLQFVNFNKLNRWDTAYLFYEINNLNSRFDLIKYGELFTDLYNGIPARHYSNNGIRFLKVSDVKQGYISENNIKYIDKYKDTDLISKNTLLITRKGTVGNSTFIRDGHKFTASSEIFIIKIDETKVLGDYFSIINNSIFVKKQYSEKNTGTIMPSISQNKLKEILIPIPTIEIQEEITSYVNSLKRQIKNLKTKAEQNRENARKEFEQEIFTKK